MCALAALLGDATSVRAQPAPNCDVASANVYRTAGDRYGTQHDFPTAEGWYLAATRSTDGCRTAHASLLNARSLAQAGMAYAQSGEYNRALDVLRLAAARLTALATAFPPVAADAQTYLDRVQTVITAIDRIAQSSM